MTTFHFIRHGEPLWELNEQRNLTGANRNFVPLTDRGVQEAETTARDPRLAHAEIVIASPYTRALQTAAIIAGHLQLPLQVEYDLHEWVPDLTFQFDLQKVVELRNDFDACNGHYPEGESRLWESRDSMRTRVDAVLEKYLHHEKVIVVCHGMLICNHTGVDQVDHAEIVEMKMPSTSIHNLQKA